MLSCWEQRKWSSLLLCSMLVNLRSGMKHWKCSVDVWSVFNHLKQDRSLLVQTQFSKGEILYADHALSVGILLTAESTQEILKMQIMLVFLHTV